MKSSELVEQARVYASYLRSTPVGHMAPSQLELAVADLLDALAAALETTV